MENEDGRISNVRSNTDMRKQPYDGFNPAKKGQVLSLDYASAPTVFEALNHPKEEIIDSSDQEEKPIGILQRILNELLYK